MSFFFIQGKENNPGIDGVVLGPVINGVRRPISANHLSSISQSDTQSIRKFFLSGYLSSFKNL